MFHEKIINGEPNNLQNQSKKDTKSEERLVSYYYKEEEIVSAGCVIAIKLNPVVW